MLYQLSYRGTPAFSRRAGRDDAPARGAITPERTLDTDIPARWQASRPFHCGPNCSK